MTDWNVITFQPCDVLAVSDPRGVDVGKYSFLAELLPSAFAGCLRTAALNHAAYDFRRPFSEQSEAACAAAVAVGLEIGHGPMSFGFAGPLLTKADSPALYVPTPAAAWSRTLGGPIEGLLAPLDRGDQSWTADSALATLCPLVAPDGVVPRPVAGYLSLRDLAGLLGGPGIGDDDATLARGKPLAASADDFYDVERRWSHERSDSGAVEPSMLYSRSYVRFRTKTIAGECRSAGFAGLVRGLEQGALPGSFVARLGGDSRRVQCRGVEPSGRGLESLVALTKVVASRAAEFRGLLVYLASPAVFASPAPWRLPGLESFPELELVAAAVGKPLAVGGWDMKTREAKPLRRAVPAGSVYYLRLSDEVSGPDATVVAEAFAKRFTLNESVSDMDGEVGFGAALVGLWDARRRRGSTEQ